MGLSPDGKLVASGGEDRRVVLSDAETLRPLVAFPPRIGRAKTLSFDATGTRLAVGGIDSEADVWELGLIRDELAALGLAWDGPAPLTGSLPMAATSPAAVPVIPIVPVVPADAAKAEDLLRGANGPD